MTLGNAIVIHKYTPSSEPPLDRDDLIKQGQDLVEAVEDPTRWRSIRLPSPNGTFLILTIDHENSYTNGFINVSLGEDGDHLSSTDKSPAVMSPGKLNTYATGIEDIIGSSNLEPFQGTDFSYLLNEYFQGEPKIIENPIVSSNPLDRPRKRKPESADGSEAGIPKRRRLDRISLHDLIPLPHHFSYPISPLQGAGEEIMERFPPFSKAPLIARAPYTSENLQKYLGDPYARVGWIVPVHGDLPWTEATFAVMDHRIQEIQDETTNFKPHDSKVNLFNDDHKMVPIMWTPEIFNCFWFDLIEIRKKNTLGAISLSFRSPPVHFTEKEESSFERTEDLIRIPPPNDSGDLSNKSEGQPRSLKDCTYVKISCDAKLALYVRAVLDAWRTEVDSIDDTTSEETAPRARPHDTDLPRDLNKKKKIRPILGARLILVDEVGCAIGIC